MFDHTNLQFSISPSKNSGTTLTSGGAPAIGFDQIGGGGSGDTTDITKAGPVILYLVGSVTSVALVYIILRSLFFPGSWNLGY